MKNILSIATIFALSITSVSLKMGKDGIEIELQRTQQHLAAIEAQANNFGLAGVECLRGE